MDSKIIPSTGSSSNAKKLYDSSILDFTGAFLIPLFNHNLNIFQKNMQLYMFLDLRMLKFYMTKTLPQL